ncbi:hypothetical protein HNP72_002244 [Sphingobacterium soli]|nr:hypothetical protein [Sphingobacterium soli]
MRLPDIGLKSFGPGGDFLRKNSNNIRQRSEEGPEKVR